MIFIVFIVIVGLPSSPGHSTNTYTRTHARTPGERSPSFVSVTELPPSPRLHVFHPRHACSCMATHPANGNPSYVSPVVAIFPPSLYAWCHLVSTPNACPLNTIVSLAIGAGSVVLDRSSVSEFFHSFAAASNIPTSGNLSYPLSEHSASASDSIWQ